MPQKEDHTTLIVGGVLAAGAIAYFTGAIDKVLESLGLKKSADEQNVDKSNVDPGSPFSPNFWKQAPPGALLITNAYADQLIESLMNDVGIFSDNFAGAFGIFKQLKTKSQVSYFADRFQQEEAADLLTWLLGTNHWPNDHFSADEVNQIINYVNNLPNYN